MEKELTISKISPFIAIIAAVVNVIGSVLIAVGASLERDSQECLFWLLIISGACMLINCKHRDNLLSVCGKVVDKGMKLGCLKIRNISEYGTIYVL